MIKNIALTCAILAGSHTAFANNNAVTCPTIEDIKHFETALVMPYGYDNASKSLKSFIYLASPKVLDEYGDEYYSIWNMMLYPVKVKSSQDANNSIADIVSKLEPVSTTPLSFEFKDGLFPIGDLCIYTVPGSEDINAIALLDDDSEDDYATAKSKGKTPNKHGRFMQIAKQFMLK